MRLHGKYARFIDKDKKSKELYDRRCIVSGEFKPREAMIRFVVSPDKSIVPDIEENLGGHGLWVTAYGSCLREAIKSRVFTKMLRRHVKPHDDLAENAALLLRKRCLSFIGLAKRAGIAVLGEHPVENAAKSERDSSKIALYLEAQDASRTIHFDNDTIYRCNIFSREELGQALGYEQIVYAVLYNHKLTKNLIADIKRLVNVLEM